MVRFVTGDETGLIKVVSMEKGGVVARLGSQAKGRSILSLAFDSEEEKDLWACTESGVVEKYKMPVTKSNKNQNQPQSQGPEASFQLPNRPIVMHKIAETNSLLFATAEGNV